MRSSDAASPPRSDERERRGNLSGLCRYGGAVTQIPIDRPKDREDEYRSRRGAVRFLTIPDHRFTMVDGSGPAASGAFEARMPGLHSTAYGLRFA